MTEEEIAELVQSCPRLYHMAACGSWRSIQTYGLLSTSALLDLFHIAGTSRFHIESCRRPASVALDQPEVGHAVVRDQLPMDDAGLQRCLQDGLSPRDWYELLNTKVFFWLSKERLLRLLNGATYRNEWHDVLEIDTARLIADYRESITLAPINTGCTKPMPHPRGKTTFLSINAYPYAEWRTKRSRKERVVELAVKHGVANISEYVVRVIAMRGSEEGDTIYEKQES